MTAPLPCGCPAPVRSIAPFAMSFDPAPDLTARQSPERALTAAAEAWARSHPAIRAARTAEFERHPYIASCDGMRRYMRAGDLLLRRARAFKRRAREAAERDVLAVAA